MRWIRLYHPFVHGTTGYWGTSKNIPNFWGWKFPPAFFIPPYHRFQLQSEQSGGSVLDQFDALNPLVASVCPYVLWFLWYEPKHRLPGWRVSEACCPFESFSYPGCETWWTNGKHYAKTQWPLEKFAGCRTGRKTRQRVKLSTQELTRKSSPATFKTHYLYPMYRPTGAKVPYSSLF